MKIIVSKFNSSKTKFDLFEEPHWDDEKDVLLCWDETKERYACDFDKAKFCLQLVTACLIKDTFYMTEKDYAQLTNLKNKRK